MSSSAGGVAERRSGVAAAAGWNDPARTVCRRSPDRMARRARRPERAGFFRVMGIPRSGAVNSVTVRTFPRKRECSGGIRPGWTDPSTCLRYPSRKPDSSVLSSGLSCPCRDFPKRVRWDPESCRANLMLHADRRLRQEGGEPWTGCKRENNVLKRRFEPDS